MATEILHNKNLKIQAYSLPDMLQEVQQGILDGYRLDYDQNETYPFGSGSYFEVTLVPAKGKKEDKVEKDEKVAEKQQAQEETKVEEVKDQEPAKRGPKPKGK